MKVDSAASGSGRSAGPARAGGAQEMPPAALWLGRASTLLFVGALAAAPLVAGTFDAFRQAAMTGTLLAAAVLRLAARRAGGARECLSTPVDLPVALLLAAALVSVLFSVNRHASIVEFLRLLSCAAALWLGVEAVWSPDASSSPAGRQVSGDRCQVSGDRCQEGGDTVRAEVKARRGDRKGKRHAAGGKAGPERAGEERPASALLDALDRPGALLWGALVAGSAWAAARGVQEYLAALREGLGAWRVFGGFSHPSTLMAHLVLTLPLMLAAVLALRARQDSSRTAWPVPALAALLALAAAAFTASRLGTLALGLGLLVFVLAYLFARRSVTPAQAAAVAVGLILLGVAVIFAVPTLRYRFMTAVTGGEAFSLGFRLTTWQAAWRIFVSHPLVGTGIGTFGSIMTRYSETSWVQTAHNHFAQTAAETGIVGLGALLALVGTWLAVAARGIRGRPQTTDHRPQTGDGRPETQDPRPKTADEGLQTTDYRPQTAGGRPLGADGRRETRDQRPLGADERRETSAPLQKSVPGLAPPYPPDLGGAWGGQTPRELVRLRTGDQGALGECGHDSATPPPHHPTTSPMPPARAALLAAALGGVAASTAFALVDFGWSVPATGLVLWALMGAGLAAAGAVRPRPAHAGLGAAALVLLCAALVANGRLLLGSMHYARATALRDASYAAVREGDTSRSAALRVEAADALADAVRVDPGWPEAHWELGRLVGGNGLAAGDRSQIEEGLKHVEEAIRLAPTVALYPYHLGLLAMRAGESERAAAAFRRALQWDPNNPPTWRKYGLLCEKWRPAETLKAARRLVEVEAGPYGALSPLGQRVEPSYAFGHYWLAEEMRRSGDASGARKEYQKAQSILERYRESLKGIGGIGADGRMSGEADPDCPPLEDAVRRGLDATAR